MKISRLVSNLIIDVLQNTNKTILIYGARQTGKTTLAKEVISKMGLNTLSVNADETKYIDILSSRDLAKMDSLISTYKMLFIDEAQRIPDIGINLKLLADNYPDLKVIVTGSSSLDIASKASESMAGRKLVFSLFPFGICEMQQQFSEFDINQKINELLVFGSYPDVFTTTNLNLKHKILEEISDAYLFKDIFNLVDIRHKSKVREVLKMLAFQIGEEVSTNEISNTLQISRDTVERYIELLEKTFIIFRVSAYSRNLRKEITTKDKIYFYDLGIRNMLINNHNRLDTRNDLGKLWENFLMSERRKLLDYNGIIHSSYFWRTYTGAEIDYIEERDGELFAYEFKYKKSNAKIPDSWVNTYKSTNFQLINIENYFKFVTQI